MFAIVDDGYFAWGSNRSQLGVLSEPYVSAKTVLSPVHGSLPDQIKLHSISSADGLSGFLDVHGGVWVG